MAYSKNKARGAARGQKSGKARAGQEKNTGRPVLILVHGFRGAPEGLEEVAELLRGKGFEVLVPEIPPTGGGLKEYTPEAYANFLAKYIKKQGLKKPALVGHSMGSIVAALMAEKHPELIHKKLVVMAPIVKHPPKLVMMAAPLTMVVPNKLASKISTGYLFAAGKQKEEGMTKQEAKAAKKELYKKCLRLTEKCGARSEKKAQREAARFSCSWGILDFDFKQELGVIVGDGDKLTTKGELEQLKLAHPGAEVKVLRGCGHIMNYERPGEVAEEICRMLS